MTMKDAAEYVLAGIMGGAVATGVGGVRDVLRRHRLRTDETLARAVHEAMQNAPHDGRDFRQARAAIAAVEARLR